MKNKPLKKNGKKEKHIVIHDLCMQMIQSCFFFNFSSVFLWHVVCCVKFWEYLLHVHTVLVLSHIRTLLFSLLVLLDFEYCKNPTLWMSQLRFVKQEADTQ